MTQVVRTQLTCHRCNTPFTAVIEQIIDVGRDPRAKDRFLSGRINVIVCPNCGESLAVGTPLAYHDPHKELMIIHVPMQLNIGTEERESLIGDLTRRITEGVPQTERKMYLLQPKMAMTIPGMIDVILDADGVTQEMREAQREKMRVMEMFLQVRPENWPTLLEEQYEHIDQEFLQMILIQAENAAQTGRKDMSEALVFFYNYMVQNTEVGRELTAAAQEQEATVREVAEELQTLGQNISREEFMALVLDYAEDDMRLQAVVGLMRPAFDQQFFQEVEARMQAAQTDEEHEVLTQLHARLLELTQIIDQQTQAVLARAADTLRVILNSEDLDAAIRPRLNEVDDTFLAVLQANLQAAQQHDDQNTYNRLLEVQEKVLGILQEAAPPQIKLISAVLGTQTDEEATQLLQAHAPQFGPELLELFDALAADLDASQRTDRADRLRRLRPIAAAFVGSAPDGDAGGPLDDDINLFGHLPQG